MKQLLQNQIERFEEEFIGKCPSYHNSQTHQNYPAKWKKRMLDVEKLKSFLISCQSEIIEKLREEIEGTRPKPKKNRFYLVEENKQKGTLVEFVDDKDCDLCWKDSKDGSYVIRGDTYICLCKNCILDLAEVVK